MTLTCIFCLQTSASVESLYCSESTCRLDVHRKCWDEYSRFNFPCITCPICRKMYMPQRITRSFVKYIEDYGLVRYFEDIWKKNSNLDVEFVREILRRTNCLESTKTKAEFYAFITTYRLFHMYNILQKEFFSMDWVICF